MQQEQNAKASYVISNAEISGSVLLVCHQQYFYLHVGVTVG